MLARRLDQRSRSIFFIVLPKNLESPAYGPWPSRSRGRLQHLRAARGILVFVQSCCIFLKIRRQRKPQQRPSPPRACGPKNTKKNISGKKRSLSTTFPFDDFFFRVFRSVRRVRDRFIVIVSLRLSQDSVAVKQPAGLMMLFIGVDSELLRIFQDSRGDDVFDLFLQNLF